jgi:uncharacterized RDD family membrane protein YckC
MPAESAAPPAKPATQTTVIPTVSPAVINQRLVISGISLIPFTVVVALLMAVLYGVSGGYALTRSVFGDVALWVVAFASYFGITYGLMFSDLENAVPSTDPPKK